MQVYKLVIDENDMHIYDENGGILPDEERIISEVGLRCEIGKIEKSLMSDENFATDAGLVSNIRGIITNYYSEKEAFTEENHYRLLRLAIGDTEEDLEEA